MILNASPYVAIKGYADSKIAKCETNDCFVRATAAAVNVTYDVAHKYVAETFKRKNRKGTAMVAWVMEKMLQRGEKFLGKSFKFIGDPISQYNPMVRPFTYYGKGDKQVRRDMTVGTAAKKFNKGRYIVLVTGHAFAIVDGVVVGNWDDSRALRKRVHSLIKIGR